MAVLVFGVRRRGPGHDEVAQGGGGSEDAVVGESMIARVWHYCDETLDEYERFKEKGLGAVAPRGAEFPEDLAFVGQREATLGEWGAGNVPAEVLA